METPKTLKNFDSYEREYLDAFLKKEQVPTVFAALFTDFMKKVIASADLCIRVPIHVLPLIAKDGRIKSVMETGTGSTVGGEKVRRETVAALFGCDVNDLAPDEYPNFGYLGTRNKMIEMFESDLGFHYGDVLITLKRDNLMDRTTVCVGDTVDFGAFRYIMPTRLSNPLFTCAGCMVHPGLEGRESDEKISGVYKLQLITKALVEEELSVKNFHKMGEMFDRICHGIEFFELQYHGGISFPGDVERIDCYNLWRNEDIGEIEKIAEQLKPQGVEVKIWDGI